MRRKDGLRSSDLTFDTSNVATQRIPHPGYPLEDRENLETKVHRFKFSKKVARIKSSASEYRVPTSAHALLLGALALVFVNNPMGYGSDTVSGQQLRKWEKIPVEGAQCGNGKTYNIFYSEGRSDRLSLGFMGGGACWNFATCFGPTPLALLFSWQFVPHLTGMFGHSGNPTRDYTHVFLPYCTGDVFAGDHVGKYLGQKTLHHGKKNTELALQTILERYPKLSQVQKLVVHGSSAGAIGALFHLQSLSEKFTETPEKILIADSPGMHFGQKFWKKFSKPMLKDLQNAFSNIGIHLDPDRGDVAHQMADLCRTYSDWRMGFLHFDRDIVMSSLFGEISRDEHEQMIYGKHGIWQTLLQGIGNCSAWIGKGPGHTVLLTNLSMMIQRDGMDVRQFVINLLKTHGARGTIPQKL